jgi:glucosamine--fructose-6-phosphate aminotransferase (isomerizing)
MCGIVGYIGKRPAVPIILDGLRRLEYRGYDSAGLAVLNDSQELVVRRASGKLRNLEEVIRLDPVDGTYGIGHTRWATHGRPTEENAHPHSDCHGDVVVVHNGIIENYIALKHQLQAEGHVFRTETDTEVIAHLVKKHLHGNLEEAVRQAATRRSSAWETESTSWPPTCPALLNHTRDVFFLADGDLALLTADGVQLSMLNRIGEQPRAVRDTILGRVGQESGRIFLEGLDVLPHQFRYRAFY